MKIKKILLTGATGFVGSALRVGLKNAGYQVVPVSRSGRDGTIVAPLQDVNAWNEALEGVDCVIHAAARVHVMNDLETDPLSAYRNLNVVPTLQLAERAAAAGAERFIFISSVKVCGETSGVEGKPLSEFEVAKPSDPYGKSKLEAELGLAEISRKTGLKIVIIRPPLVYGPGVKANFKSLMKLIACGVPLPFSRLNNKRSLVGIQNLSSFVIHCVEHPAAVNQTFFVSDGRDLSTAELSALLGKILRGRARMFPLPVWVLRCAGFLLGKSVAIDRLVGSLQVDISKASQTLEWVPPHAIEEQLRLTAVDFCKTNPQHAIYPDGSSV